MYEMMEKIAIDHGIRFTADDDLWTVLDRELEWFADWYEENGGE